jgi:hypothetical protein
MKLSSFRRNKCEITNAQHNAEYANEFKHDKHWIGLEANQSHQHLPFSNRLGSSLFYLLDAFQSCNTLQLQTQLAILLPVEPETT